MARYIRPLDGIRGFGIFFVLLFHYLMLIGRPALTFSWVWVQMFFVQSGFLITGILLNDKQRRLAEYLKRFYSRRALRIFPLYFSFILVFTVAYRFFHKPMGFNRYAPYLYTYTFNFTRFDRHIDTGNPFVHFWSLALEEQFYLVWPFIIYFLNREQLKRVLLAVIVLTPLFRFWLARYLGTHGFDRPAIGEITYVFTFSQFDAFAFGAAIPVFGLAERVKRTGLLAVCLTGLAVLAGLTNLALVHHQGLALPLDSLGLGVGNLDNYQHVWSYTVVDLAFMAVTLHLISLDYRGMFDNGPLAGAGKIVYGTYVFHYVVLLAIVRMNERYLHNAVASFVLAGAICWFAAYVSYNAFEKKFLALKQ